MQSNALVKQAARPSAAQRRTRPQRPCARYGGGMGGMGGGRGGGGGGFEMNRRDERGLIMPGEGGGQGNQGGRPSTLYVPGQESQSQLGGRQLLDATGKRDAEARSGPVNPFRPPPGFMEGSDVKKIDMDPDTMLRRLGAMAAPWHELADLLLELNRQGYDGTIIEEMADIPRPVQSCWMVASNVYRTLVKTGELTEDELSYFDPPERAECLLEMRNVTAERRAPAARYIQEQGFDGEMSTVLARAVKEHERKRDGYHNFSEHPGDALAFKYWRDANEARRKDDIERFAKKGLACCVTDGARAAFDDFFASDKPRPDALQTYPGEINFVRLTAEETAFRPLPVVGALGEVAAAQVEGAPRTGVRGAFLLFKPGGDAGLEWASMPAWLPLQKAKAPVGLIVEDCAQHAELLFTAQAKNKDDAKRLREGEAMIIGDRREGIQVQPKEFYLVDEGGRAVLASGAAVGERTVLAEVLMAVRPFAPEMKGLGASLMKGVKL
ncbi:unnamed protein product [Pedinophyceae sp. YPF-701]|nr:unnamed protein product [Pedinophyceae sp. YPF-701]